MAEVRIDIHQDYVRWLGTADDSPVNQFLDDAADELLAAAEVRAPVADRGVWTKGHRHYTPPGFTKSSLRVADRDHDDDGELVRFVGTRTSEHGGAWPFPLAFAANEHLVTRNRDGSLRAADNFFLQEALDAVPEQVWR